MTLAGPPPQAARYRHLGERGKPRCDLLRIACAVSLSY